MCTPKIFFSGGHSWGFGVTLPFWQKGAWHYSQLFGYGFLSESSTQEQTKSLDVNSSKDLKALLTHSDDESEKASTTKPVTNYSNVSKEVSKSKVAVTRPSSEANRVTSSSQTPMMQNETVKNQSFLQASLGEISPSEQQQSQLSSVLGDISPQNSSLTPPSHGQNNVTENVRDLLFFVFILFQ